MSAKGEFGRREFLVGTAASAIGVALGLTKEASAQGVENLPQWPTTPEAAAALFGGTADRWEISADGGWHLREESFITWINPAGRIAEGYFDTMPGKNPFAFVSVGAEVPMQGGTIWNVTGLLAAQELQSKMAIPVWEDRVQHPAVLISPGGQLPATAG